ncbi:MAG: hypothetical protein ACE14T_07260 [Syntrophales bacterium]
MSQKEFASLHLQRSRSEEDSYLLDMCNAGKGGTEVQVALLLTIKLERFRRNGREAGCYEKKLDRSTRMS